MTYKEYMTGWSNINPTPQDIKMRSIGYELYKLEIITETYDKWTKGLIFNYLDKWIYHS